MDEAIEYIASRKWIADEKKYCFDTIYVFDDKVLTEVVVDGMCVVGHMIPNSIMQKISADSFKTVFGCGKR